VQYYALTEALRQSFKRPLGELVAGTEAECNGVLADVVAKEKPSMIILVGDTVSRNAVQSGIEPNVLIIDKLEKRGKALPFLFRSRRIIRTKNRAGRIEMGAWRAIEQAIKESGALVEVDGEEDLLAIAAVLTAPNGSLVVYGQPDSGIVIVRVSEDKKFETRKVLDSMEQVG
jgi:uncharacterized protein (UPF0218 family)